MSSMLVEKGIEHGWLHLNGMNNWKFMKCGGVCSHCGSVDPGRATGMAQTAWRFSAECERPRHVGQRLPAKEAVVGVCAAPERYSRA